MTPVMEKRMRRLVDKHGDVHTSVSIHTQGPSFCSCCGESFGMTAISTFNNIGYYICENCNHISARGTVRCEDASRYLSSAISQAIAKGVIRV